MIGDVRLATVRRFGLICTEHDPNERARVGLEPETWAEIRARLDRVLPARIAEAGLLESASPREYRNDDPAVEPWGNQTYRSVRVIVWCLEGPPELERLARCVDARNADPAFVYTPEMVGEA